MLTKLFKKIILFYQWQKKYWSPYKTCVFEPTCSAYAITAMEAHGFLKGSFLAIKRIGRCHPWQKNKGWDPVPPKE